MDVIGVLDLKGGTAVHARGGRRDAYAPVPPGPLVRRAGDALSLARTYLSPVVGVRALYAADLDAIEGDTPQRPLLAELAALGAPLWVDAGVRVPDDATALLRLGDNVRVVVGLETLTSLDDLARIATSVGAPERLAFSLDLRDRVPLVGTATLGALSAAELAAAAAARGVGTVIVLDLARVGRHSGPDLALVTGVRDALPADRGLVAGGGVRDREDLEALAAAGCAGALVASALLEGRLSAEDIAAARRRAGNAGRHHTGWLL